MTRAPAEPPYANIRAALTDPVDFSRLTLPDFAMRDYQTAPVRAIWKSVIHQKGKQFAIVFSRQAGKDESLAQLVAAILSRFRFLGGSIVIAAPTKMQADITVRRIHDRLLMSPMTRAIARRRGDTIHVGRASVTLASAGPDSNARGLTASLLLVANEAQDIDPAKWDAVFDPMAASTNATTLFMGTVWSNAGLLDRQMSYLETVETPADRRVFKVDWREVEKVVPAYGERVRQRIEQMGEAHPYIRTEYFLEKLSGQGTLFSAAVLAQLQGTHDRARTRSNGRQYAVLVDVAGEQEVERTVEGFDPFAQRDSTAATVVELVTAREGSPGFRIVDRRLWTGLRHTILHPILHDWARAVWGARWVVVDATGLGEGLADLLADSLGSGPQRSTVIKHRWNSANKSDAGWSLLAMMESGRLKDYVQDGDALTVEFWRTIPQVIYEVLPGPGKRIKWSVPQKVGHDDLLMSLALLPALDKLDLRERVARGN